MQRLILLPLLAAVLSAAAVTNAAAQNDTTGAAVEQQAPLAPDTLAVEDSVQIAPDTIAADGSAPLPPGRPADNLLERPELQRIVEWQEARAGDSLMSALNSRDADVRARAAFALGSVQSTAAQADLVGLLDDTDPNVRADAAFAIGQLPDSLLAAPLVRALAQEFDTSAAGMMLFALGNKGDRRSLAQVTSMDLPAALEDERALTIGRYALRRVHHPEAVQYLLAALASPDPSVRRSAAYYFGRSRNTDPWAAQADTVRRRLEALSADDPAAMHLVLGLGRLSEERFTWPLLRWMRTATDWRTRVNAARALANYTDQSTVQSALITTARTAPYHVALRAMQTLNAADTWTDSTRMAAKRLAQEYPRFPQLSGTLVAGLARHGADSLARTMLTQWLDTGSAGLSYALQALAFLPESEATRDLLRRAASSTDDKTAFAAYQAAVRRWDLSEQPEQVADAYYDLFEGGIRSDNVAALYTIAPVLSDSLFLQRGALDLMVSTYRRLSSPEYLEPMAALLGSIGSSGDRSAVPLLENGLTHPHPAIRRAAARALQNLTDREVVTEPLPSPIRTTIDWEYLSNLGPLPRLVLETERGTVTLAIKTSEAPLTAETILQLAESNAYDGIPFHRVVSNFVIQGGDVARANGFGGPGFTIPSEFTRISYARGRLGMASAGKDTEGSQYFVTHSMQPHLDGRYTAFGYVVEGMDVVDRIREGDLITDARVLPTP